MHISNLKHWENIICKNLNIKLQYYKFMVLIKKITLKFNKIVFHYFKIKFTSKVYKFLLKYL
ncbi:hypothetical protein NUSPORA_02034 [Nucleospora cyclopteri]